jgi:tetratricopeptide (TPR) repeat protein
MILRVWMIGAVLIASPAAAPKEQRKSYDLVGTLTSSDFRPFADGLPTVSLHSMSAPFATRTIADARGKFKFKKLQPGTYVLLVFVPRSRQLRKTVEVGPSFADAKGRVATMIAYERRLIPGRTYAVSATQLAVPDSARLEFQKGQEYLERRDSARARAAFQKAVDLAPQFAGAWNSLGTLALQTQQYGEAQKAFREALKQNPAYYGALVNLGGALLADGKLEEALTINQRAVRVRPEDPLAQTQLGHSYFFLGRLDEAEKHLKEAEALEPEHFSFPQLMLAEIYVRRQNFSAVVRELEQFLKLHPDSKPATDVRKALDAARQTIAQQQP